MKVEKSLFICDTPFQILSSILIIYNDGKEDGINDFIVTDHMQGAVMIAKCLNEQNIVRYACCVHVSHIEEKKLIRKMHYLLDNICSFDKRWYYKYKSCVYDNLYVRNFSEIIATSAYTFFGKRNSNLHLYVIDEGYSTYTISFWKSEQYFSSIHKLINKIYKLKFGNGLYNKIYRAKLFFPELLHVQLPFEIERMLEKDFVLNENQIKTINRIFNYSNPIKKEQYKYIFFEESFYTDSGNTSDLSMLEDIAKIVGKDKIVVKLHPRTVVDRFTLNGFSVMSDVIFPWELYGINNINSSIILLAYSSGALLNYLFFTKSKMKSILLYQVYPELFSNIKEEIKIWFKDFCGKYPDIIFVPKSIEELENYLINN